MSLLCLALASDLALAWLREGKMVTRTASGVAMPARSPLGSTWKLFVHAYASERELATPAYRCQANPMPGEEYCCAPGEAIDRDVALARSCGLFFEPARLGITAADWRAFWVPRSDVPWLAELERLRPETEVPVRELLQALAAVPEASRAAAGRALLPVFVEGYGRDALPELGGLLRIKTFTWRHPALPGASLGGGAGWLVDGTPVWFAARGSSRRVLSEHAAELAAWLPAPESAPDDACVEVDYFARYPLIGVDELPVGAPAAPGPLHGRFRASFESGTAVVFESSGELRLAREAGRWRIRGRLGAGDYLARVLDREADPGVVPAARALAVVARTWLLQNAPFEAGCFRVEDSTRAQRVAASPPSGAARRAVRFSEGLLLEGAAVRYRREGAEPGVLSWQRAVEQARAGLRFDAILLSAFPGASLASVTGERECRRLADAEAWLARARSRWQPRLAREPGFEAPSGPLLVCQLDHGHPYSDADRLRIHLRGLRSREDRITLAHEYLHLGLRFHPRGTDEDFVERLARSLAEE